MSDLTHILTARRNSKPTVFELEGKPEKPCPFCGSYDLGVEQEEGIAFWVICIGCNARGPMRDCRRWAVFAWQNMNCIQ